MDSFRATYRTKEGKAFLIDIGFNPSTTFSIKRYGEHVCSVFCRYWVAKMSFLFALSSEGVDTGEKPFSELAFGRFVEPAEFTEVAETPGGHVLERVRALRDLKPI